MKKSKIISKPTRLSDISFDDLMDDSDDWQLKAERLIYRREKELRRRMAS